MSKEKSKLKSLTFVCECGKEVTLDANLCYFSAISQECDTCGSHGDITISFDCPKCKKNVDVEVKEW